MSISVRLLQSSTVSTARRENNAISMLAQAEGVFTADECANIITLSQSLLEGTGTINNRTASNQTSSESIRKSMVKFLNPDADSDWIFKRVEKVLVQINRSYRFDLQGFFEGAQIATYTQGGHYQWHKDIGSGVSSCRKMSLSVQLSDPDTYEGGGLEFMNIEEDTLRSIGSLIAFPSYLTHRVTPVTQGTRTSMVTWISGPPFR